MATITTLGKTMIAFSAAALLAACGGDPENPTPEGSPLPAPSSAAPAGSAETPASDGASAEGVPIRLSFGNTTLTARLNGTPAAAALADQLPITLPFRDLMSQEKISRLPQPLPTNGVPEGDDPVPGDIGYYSPEGNLVLYYGDVGFWNGIVRIGSFEGGRDEIQRQVDGFPVKIERAN